MKLPIKLGWEANKPPIRLDLLPHLRGICALHIHKSEGENNGHLKLEYDNTPYCLSLFIWNLDKFFRNEEVKVRSYDLWDKSILFAARLPNGNLHPQNPGFVYREDAIIIDWGTYELKSSSIRINFVVRKVSLNYKIIFLGVRRYYSPKYGYSTRSEYLFKPLNK